MIQQGLSQENMSDKPECQVCDLPVVCHTFLDCEDMPLYVTKIICNIHWNHNGTYNLKVYLFVFNNYDTINDQIILMLVNYRNYKEIFVPLSASD